MYVCLCRWTSVNVPVPARFDVLDLYTGVFAAGRVFTCPYRPASVCTPSARVCPPWTTSVQVHVLARFGVYALCSCVYALGPA